MDLRGALRRVAVGFHRENIKKTIRRLEDENVLVGDRRRRPRFDLRKFTISPKCPAARSSAPFFEPTSPAGLGSDNCSLTPWKT